MSVLIKGMMMPENGSCIQIVIDDDGKVYPSVEKCILKMGSIANAVPVPPHGRLIDADALCGRLEKAGKIKPYLESGLNLAISFALTAPTAIPAEEGER